MEAIAIRNKDATNGAPGIATRSKKLLRTNAIAIRFLCCYPCQIELNGKILLPEFGTKRRKVDVKSQLFGWLKLFFTAHRELALEDALLV